MSNFNLRRIFLLSLLFAIGVACYFVFRQFLVEFMIAVILVSAFYPIYDRMVKIFRGHRKTASLVLVLLIILLVIVPLLNFLFYTGQRIVTTYNESADFFNSENLEKSVEAIADNFLVKRVFFFVGPEITLSEYFMDKAKTVQEWFLSGSGNPHIIKFTREAVTGTVNTFLSILIVIFSMFFFFIDGEKMLSRLMHLTPLPEKYDRAIFKKFKDVSFSTIISTFITALAQGLIGAIGFLIVGFPVFFASVIMAFASVIPYVGTALVWVPVSLYLLAVGQIWQGIFILIWGSVVVGNSDNLIRTYLIKGKSEVHPLFVFFSILGGLSLFGFWGIFFGPLIISLAVTILHIYEMEYDSVLNE